jgi:release factor glutamine methyltransferase
MRAGEALALARQLGVARLDALLLLSHHTQRERTWLLAHDEYELTATAQRLFHAHLLQRADDVPLAYLVGHREFYGLRIEVDENVLVPRPETEGLVDWALELLRATPASAITPRLLDLGTGSGAIALALKSSAPATCVWVADVSAAALAVAARNAARLDLTIHFSLSDWWSGLQGESFDMIVSNPPYVAGQDPHLQALRHEPQTALTPDIGGLGDGLNALQTITQGAPAHLAAGGWLLLEHGHDQADAVAAMLKGSGFVDVALRRDLAGLPRCSAGRRPA